ncbi:DNA N-6-adenine-methyltransferase [Acidihalobacter ferrooxydans]|uniref:Adenine methyltransferase n=1 Tax=Acidihalobacter ferrooxydans TaxID=1765967 RepID=A0A1P8UIX4_9GAMM|nr:DNA N-6-adenine-methyltransferase [Acidihalobacter ferrooxydans]APZ43789.1 hypothetical protein BW247_12415 [Acidihalobacter ferrooxydans]
MNSNASPKNRGRPRIHEDQRAAWRAASRAYRKRKKQKVYHKSNSDEWYTPPDLAEHIMQNVAHRDAFDIDPCAPAEPPYTVEAARRLTAADDGLAHDWGEPGTIAWVNPPYSQMKKWIEKCLEQAGHGVVVIALVPARTGTRWWSRAIHDAADGHATAHAYTLPGRLRFYKQQPDNTIIEGDSAPFDSAILIWNLSLID